MVNLVQSPSPGQKQLAFCGDTVTFTLTHHDSLSGAAWVRTNLGRAVRTRRRIIAQVDHPGGPTRGDWSDVPMKRVDRRTFSVTLALTEVGHFEAKAFFLKAGASGPSWPPGPNTVINVKPAVSYAGNTVYNVFVRQFGRNLEKQALAPVTPDDLENLDREGYAVIPPSGKLRDVIEHLDHIVDRLGCRILLLLPINPTPTTYGRLGRYGSPYAALSFFTVDPALAEFDVQATPLEQFEELVDAVHSRSARLFLDVAINHTGWAADLHAHHPEWLARDADGTIEKPGAWGVTWHDLARLDYRHRELWAYMAEVFLTWCRRGVDGFRCDAGYMVPVEAWRYIISRVRERYPESVFLLEGLGGPPETTRRLLDDGGFDQAYSELFQNYSRDQIQSYLPSAIETSERDGITVHFAETHDNTRLADVSPEWAGMRTSLCALLAPNGAFGFANGVEWLARERINVHGSASLNWGAEENLVERIGMLNRILTDHPAFHHPVALRMVSTSDGESVAVLRHNTDLDRKLLILANLDAERAGSVSWEESVLPEGELLDLLSGRGLEIQAGGPLSLEPGQVLCLSADPEDLALRQRPALGTEPAAVRRQRLRTRVLQAVAAIQGSGDVSGHDVEALVPQLSADPDAFCLGLTAQGAPRVTHWRWPRDLRREVMVPPGHLLLLQADHPFRISLEGAEDLFLAEESLREDSGGHFVLLPPLPVPSEIVSLTLGIRVFTSRRTESGSTTLLLLPRGEKPAICPPSGERMIDLARTGKQVGQGLFLGTNGRGAMLRAAAAWGHLTSRYDGLLAANLDENVPEDRRVLLSRYRVWLDYQGYSHQLGPDCQERVSMSYQSRCAWSFRVPAGRGRHVCVTLHLSMRPGENAVDLVIRRTTTGEQDELDPGAPVTLIVRPDVEDRNIHHTTKASLGPEGSWPQAVRHGDAGFAFAPHPPVRLEVRGLGAAFVPEPEWHYSVHRSLEASRGLDPDSDLFSPGFFRADLTGTGSVWISAEARTDDEGGNVRDWEPALKQPGGALPLETALRKALTHYVVKRDANHTIIAGYPWFLDWGRDTLIVVRGIVAAGELQLARSILAELARFEEDGTLPNMIRGEDAGNRDTSDAPLWFLVACADLLQAEGTTGFLETACGDRTVGGVALDLARRLETGARNGVKMDPETGLLFSPTHFTWMDTNHPAGTPRRGYPIEIQALWFASLKFLGQATGDSVWRKRAEQVSKSIMDLFYRAEWGYLVDCLHCDPDTPASEAQADDCLRPNQLLAVTLGAVTDNTVARRVLASCEELLVPGGIRSLADREVAVPLPVERDGQLLNDPHRPYWGRYLGDEDTRRKPAYHNGTAWTWQFPLYAEAWMKVYGRESRGTARAWLSSSIPLLQSGCLGQVPEILDGDRPHGERGCDAQAWGVSELLRVWLAAEDG